MNELIDKAYKCNSSSGVSFVVGNHKQELIAFVVSSSSSPSSITLFDSYMDVKDYMNVLLDPNKSPCCCGIIALLSMAAPFFVSLERQQQSLQPSPDHCIQYLQAIARHEDAFYTVWNSAASTLSTSSDDQQQQQDGKTNLEFLPLECTCLSAIFKILTSVATHIVRSGRPSQTIVSTGILCSLARMAQFWGDSSNSDSKSTLVIPTPVHAEFVQLCFLAQKYTFAISAVSSFATAGNMPSNCTTTNTGPNSNTTNKTTLLLPMTVEHYLLYYYTLGTIYFYASATSNNKSYYKRAMDMWNICISTPTNSNTNTNLKQQPSTTPSTDRAAFAVSVLQIAARKKQMLLSCLFACSNNSTTAKSDTSSLSLPPMPLLKSRYDSNDLQSNKTEEDEDRDVAQQNTLTSHEEQQLHSNERAEPQQQGSLVVVSQQQATNIMNPKNSSACCWPWSLPSYTSPCVYNLFFFDPSMYYHPSKRHQQQQTDTGFKQQQKVLPCDLDQYNSLIASYWYGDLPSFRKIASKMENVLKNDGNLDFMEMMEESFVVRMICTLANVYEAIPYPKLMEHLAPLFALDNTFSEEEDTFFRKIIWSLEKAKECVPDFYYDIDQKSGFIHFFLQEEETEQDYSNLLSNKMAQCTSLAERIQALDISIATSTKYQAYLRSSKEPKQGATGKVTLSSAVSGNISWI